MRSKLVEIKVRNIGCIGPEAVSIKLDEVLCLVGPNNSGKTTILRAYELAASPGSFTALDRCNWAPIDEPSEIILDVHIPEGMGNVDAQWKIVAGDLLIVRSRWQWGPNGKLLGRQTWDPETDDWAVDRKAGGADNVFVSRLPKPMRIKSLDDAITTEDVLLTLALSPFVNALKLVEADQNSDLSKAKSLLAEAVNGLTAPHQDRLAAISDQVQAGFRGVFPDLGVRLHVEMLPPDLKLDALLKNGSGIQVEEAAGASKISQQGTGARRALFWSMLQVHNELARTNEKKEAVAKSLESSIKSEEKKPKKDVEKIALMQSQLDAIRDGGVIPEDADDPALPGYILLIDEPENALHPMAARAAQCHLYALAEHQDWQVLLTTHSPYFVNPLADHTTIIRMERGDDGKTLSPRIYVSDDAKFSTVEKENLQALQMMDVGFSEIFFGSYPIVVEGDTEHAAFLAAVVNADNAMAGKVSIIRARGKAILVPLIKMLRHFKADFGVVHDIDWPGRSDEAANGMWKVNNSIRHEVLLCRDAGLNVRHRWSVPDFERFLGGDELGKDKPFAAYSRVSTDEALKERIRGLIEALYRGDDLDPPGHDEGAGFLDQLRSTLESWAAAAGEADNIRLHPKVKAPKSPASLATSDTVVGT